MAYKNPDDRRVYHRQYMRDRREILKKYHMCADCGKQDAYTLNGRYRCFECNEKHRKSETDLIKIEKERETPLPRNQRFEYGLCYMCGKQIENYDLKWNVNRPRLCLKCYERTCEAAKKASEAYKARHGGRTWGQMKYDEQQAYKKFRESEKVRGGLYSRAYHQ